MNLFLQEKQYLLKSGSNLDIQTRKGWICDSIYDF